MTDERREPETEAEWQQVVENAEFLLLLDCCHSVLGLFDTSRQYGLLNEAGVIDAKRCSAMLEAGRRRGIVSRSEQVEKARSRCAPESVGWPF